jgi:hypothetical protein
MADAEDDAAEASSAEVELASVVEDEAHDVELAAVSSMNSWMSTPLANCSTGTCSTNASRAGNSLSP